MEQPTQPPAFQINLSRRLLTLIGGAILSVALAAAIIVVIHPRSPFPKDISQKALFDLYYPSHLPAGYRINKDSMQFVDNTVVFGVPGPNGSHIAITEQALPRSFDFNSFYQSLVNYRKLDHLPYTTIVGRNIGHPTVMSIATANTWLLITSNQQLSTSDLRLIAGHLRQ